MGATHQPPVDAPVEALSAPATVETAEPVDTTTEPAAETASEPVVAEAAPETVAEVKEAKEAGLKPEDFGWDSWDGALEGLPEEQRGWSGRVMEWVEARNSDKTAENERLADYYAKFLDGVEDPRIAELGTKVDEIKAQNLTVAQERDAIRKEYDEYQEAVRSHYEGEMARAADKFKSEHGWLFDGGVKEQTASEMVDEGWPISALPVVLKLKPQLVAKARERFGSHPGLDAAGKEDRAALIMELIAAAPPKKPKNKSADLVAGTDSTPSQSPRVGDTSREGKSLRQQKFEAARRTLSKAGRRA